MRSPSMHDLPGGYGEGARWRRRLARRVPGGSEVPERARRSEGHLRHRSKGRRWEGNPRSQPAEILRAAGERQEQCPKDRDPVPAMVGGNEAVLPARRQRPVLNQTPADPATSGCRLLIERQRPERWESSPQNRRERSPGGAVPAWTPSARTLARVKVGGRTRSLPQVPLLILNRRRSFPTNCSHLLTRRTTRSRRTMCAL